MSGTGANQQGEWLPTGIIACPDGMHLGQSSFQSIANHSFGAAAWRDSDQELQVTFYTDIRGRRARQIHLPASVWDNFICTLTTAHEQGIDKAYSELEVFLRQRLGHTSIGPLVKFDLENSDPLRRVTINSGGPESPMLQDSIASFNALVQAAADPTQPLTSNNLETVTEFVRRGVYEASAPG